MKIKQDTTKLVYKPVVLDPCLTEPTVQYVIDIYIKNQHKENHTLH